MDGSFHIRLIAAKHTSSPVLLSVGYSAGHVVVELDGAHAVERALAFVTEHRADTGGHWMEIGRFASCPVTLYVDTDLIAVLVDSI